MTYKANVGTEKLKLLVFGLPDGLRALLKVEEAETLGNLVCDLVGRDGGSAYGAERRGGSKKAARRDNRRLGRSLTEPRPQFSLKKKN